MLRHNFFLFENLHVYLENTVLPKPIREFIFAQTQVKLQSDTHASFVPIKEKLTSRDLKTELGLLPNYLCL